MGLVEWSNAGHCREMANSIQMLMFKNYFQLQAMSCRMLRYAFDVRWEGVPSSNSRIATASWREISCFVSVLDARCLHVDSESCLAFVSSRLMGILESVMYHVGFPVDSRRLFRTEKSICRPF